MFLLFSSLLVSLCMHFDFSLFLIWTTTFGVYLFIVRITCFAVIPKPTNITFVLKKGREKMLILSTCATIWSDSESGVIFSGKGSSKLASVINLPSVLYTHSSTQRAALCGGIALYSKIWVVSCFVNLHILWILCWSNYCQILGTDCSRRLLWDGKHNNSVTHDISQQGTQHWAPWYRAVRMYFLRPTSTPYERVLSGRQFSTKLVKYPPRSANPLSIRPKLVELNAFFCQSH